MFAIYHRSPNNAFIPSFLIGQNNDRKFLFKISKYLLPAKSKVNCKIGIIKQVSIKFKELHTFDCIVLFSDIDLPWSGQFHLKK